MVLGFEMCHLCTAHIVKCARTCESVYASAQVTSAQVTLKHNDTHKFGKMCNCTKCDELKSIQLLHIRVPYRRTTNNSVALSIFLYLKPALKTTTNTAFHFLLFIVKKVSSSFTSWMFIDEYVFTRISGKTKWHVRE